MNHLDLFSGIGGFALGARLAGFKFDQTYFSEIDEYAIKVFEKNFPSAVGLGDIRGIDGREIRSLPSEEWIVTGGFPCQDISSAGKGRGLAGNRSGLWYEMLRVIDELRPRWVIAENVPALTYRGLDRVLCSLASIGFDAEWQVLSGRARGAPHLRERLWIVAYPSDTNRNLLEQRIRQCPTSAGYLGDHGKSDWSIETPPTWSDWSGEVAKREMAGRPVLCRMDDGIPGRLERSWRNRGKSLGNAIVPQVTELIFRRITSGTSYEEMPLRPA